MAKNFTAAIDVGTQSIRIGLAEELIEDRIIIPKIIGSVQARSEGLRQGCIVEKTEAVNSVKRVKAEAEKKVKVRIKNALLSVGGTSLSGITSAGETIVSRADLEITELDLAKLMEICEENIPKTAILNRKILHTIPISFKLDGKPIIGSPLGMKGNKIEMKCLFVTVLERHLNDLIEVVEDAGIEVLDLVAAPIASSLILLSKQQKRAGCVLIDIGSETVSMIVYENNLPISLEVFPTGSSHITNDIALGLKISLEEAEHVKKGGLTTTNYPRKKLEEIIEARLGDIFDTIEFHLKKINRSGLLPAGVIFTGSGSNVPNIEEQAKAYLKLPAKIGMIPTSNPKDVKDTSWAIIYGLCLLGLNSRDSDKPLGEMARKTQYKIKRFIKQFLP